METRELFLDTTYVMPFFYFDINVREFSRSMYNKVIKSLDRVHVSEVSIFEAKAKCLKLSRAKVGVIGKFNEGLSVLSTDEKVVIHGYRVLDDRKFNEYLPLNLAFFDTVILAQSSATGTSLLTEDTELLKLKNIGVKIINWQDLLREMGIEK